MKHNWPLPEFGNLHSTDLNLDCMEVLHVYRQELFCIAIQVTELPKNWTKMQLASDILEEYTLQL